MKGRAPWARPLGVVGLAALAACGQDLGPAGLWVPWDAIDGALRPEVGAPAMRAARVAPLDPLRVVSFNVKLGEDVDGLARALAEDPALASAGLVLVQEMESYPAEGRSRTARLAEALGMAYAYLPARPEGDGTHGLSILSAFPIENLVVMELPHAELVRGGNRRIAVAADVRLGNTSLHIVNVHLDTLMNVTDRILQLRPAVIDAPARVIVAGDFNTNAYVWAESTVPILPVDSVADTDQAPILDDYMAHLGFEAPTAGLGPTEHMFGLESRLDAVYTRGLAARPGGVERDVDLSDHWPIWVDVTVR